jgi:peroxiredoxin
MKIAAVALAALLCLDGEKAELGKTCPDLALKDLSGKEVKLSDFRKSDKTEGKIVLVTFWSYKCPSGAAIMKDVAAAAEKCEKEGIAFVGICAYGETEDQIRKYVEREQVKYALCFDTNYAGTKLFDAKVVTASYVLDREGKLVYRGSWDQALNAALAAKDGKAIEKNDTKAKG